jgi:hypothetical protein
MSRETLEIELAKVAQASSITPARLGMSNEQTIQIGPSVQLSIASAGNQAMGLPLVSSKTS